MTTRDQQKHKHHEFAAVLRARGIEREDHELLRFAVSWLPYDGPPSDEILVRFGLTRECYLGRLRQTVDKNRRQIHPATAARLLEVCDAAPAAQTAGGRQSQASQAVPHSAH